MPEPTSKFAAFVAELRRRRVYGPLKGSLSYWYAKLPASRQRL